MRNTIEGLLDRPTARAWLAAGAALLVALLAVIQVAAFRDSRDVRQQLDRSYDRQILLGRLLSLHQDIETGQRGYTITGKREYLQPFLNARPQISTVFAALSADSDSADFEHDLGQLKDYSARKVAISLQVISLRNSAGKDAAASEVASGRGRVVMDAFRREVAEMRGSESARQQQLLQSYASTSFRTQLYTGLLQLMLLILLAGAFVAYLANLKRLRSMTDTARDISNRQTAIFDASTDAMIVVDQKACVESVNPAAEKLFGLEGAALVGKTVQDLFEGGTLHIAGYNERRKRRREGDSIRHLTGRRGNGSTFEAEVAASPVELSEGARTLLLVRDSTERNRMERMKNEFVSTVSHELRTPLTSIRGALALMDHAIGTELAEKPRQLLKIAKSNSERLSLLVDDILDIEKIGSGRLDLVLEPIDVREVLKRAEEQNQTYASDRGVKLLCNLTDEPLLIMGDSNRLLQAFTNLISNAAKFSPQRGMVSLIAERIDRSARISVADQGTGIPVEFRSQIFDRFAQASGQSGQRTGTGLGLAITKAIVDLHKGKIDYETTIGEGTRFWIDLPLARGTRNGKDASANPAG